MQDIHELILKRNAMETTPFIVIHESMDKLQQKVDVLQEKYEQTLRGENVDTAASSSAAMKNEKKLLEKIEKLQGQLNAQLNDDNAVAQQSLQVGEELEALRQKSSSQEKELEELRVKEAKNAVIIEKLTLQLESVTADKNLAEEQCNSLQTSLRDIEAQNKASQQAQTTLEDRIVSEKAKTAQEMNQLTDLVSSLKREVDMLRAMQRKQETRSQGWMGGKKRSSSLSEEPTPPDEVVVALPTRPQHKLSTGSEGTCVRYDASGTTDSFATAATDGLIHIWEGTKVVATLQGSQPMMTCDLYGSLCVGASNDKTCRVWNTRTQRMLHHLVGHQHKITSVRFTGDGKAVLTASTDATIKVWDITRRTYRQTTTLKHSSTCHSLDVGTDPSTVVSGHNDGGLRFWDLRTSSSSSEFTDIHKGAIASVHLNPANDSQILTSGLDSTLKLIDVRNGKVLTSMIHGDFVTSHAWSRAVLSPNGKYAAAGSNSNGYIFIWNLQETSATLISKLEGHEGLGVCGIDWKRRGTKGGEQQQVTTIDRKGNLILWG